MRATSEAMRHSDDNFTFLDGVTVQRRRNIQCKQTLTNDSVKNSVGGAHTYLRPQSRYTFCVLGCELEDTRHPTSHRRLALPLIDDRVNLREIANDRVRSLEISSVFLEQ